MTDHKFTDDEIIHSLKVCSTDGDCSECRINPHKGNYGYCTSLAIKAALDLISRQKAEIEAKEEEYADLLGQRNAVEMMLDRANYNCDKADEEIEYLKSENALLITSNSQLEARVCEDRAEIEGLQAVHADMTESLRLASEANKDMQAEIERLIKANNRDDLQHKYCNLIEDVLVYSKSLEDYNKFRKSFKSEAIKEFAERLTSKLNCIPQHHFMLAEVLWDIDTLVKEMTEERK